MYHVKTMAGEYAVKRLNPEIMKRPEALTNFKPVTPLQPAVYYNVFSPGSPPSPCNVQM